MALDPIATRYAQVLFDAATAEGRRDEALGHLAFLRALLADHPDLRELLRNPDVEPEEKLGVVDRSLKGAWSDLLRAFLRMVISLGRAESLPGIAEAFQAAVDEEEGRLRVVVRSAHVLPKPLLARLRAALARREKRQVDLQEEVAPELLGGVQVHLDHRVIDGSVRRQLAELREHLSAVRP